MEERHQESLSRLDEMLGESSVLPPPLTDKTRRHSSSITPPLDDLEIERVTAKLETMGVDVANIPREGRVAHLRELSKEISAHERSRKLARGLTTRSRSTSARQLSKTIQEQQASINRLRAEVRESSRGPKASHPQGTTHRALDLAKREWQSKIPGLATALHPEGAKQVIAPPPEMEGDGGESLYAAQQQAEVAAAEAFQLREYLAVGPKVPAEQTAGTKVQQQDSPRDLHSPPDTGPSLPMKFHNLAGKGPKIFCLGTTILKNRCSWDTHCNNEFHVECIQLTGYCVHHWKRADLDGLLDPAIFTQNIRLKVIAAEDKFRARLKAQALNAAVHPADSVSNAGGGLGVGLDEAEPPLPGPALASQQANVGKAPVAQPPPAPPIVENGITRDIPLTEASLTAIVTQLQMQGQQYAEALTKDNNLKVMAALDEMQTTLKQRQDAQHAEFQHRLARAGLNSGGSIPSTHDVV